MDASWEFHDLEGTTFTFLIAERLDAAKGRPQTSRGHFKCWNPGPTFLREGDQGKIEPPAVVGHCYFLQGKLG